VTGSLALSRLASPGTTQYTNKLANWLIIYRTFSLSLCVILTSLIAGRLITVYRRSPGLRHTRSPLKDVAFMLAQSAMLETVFTLVYVITVGFGSPLQNAFLPILGQIQVKIHVPISPLLYDLRHSQVIAPMLVIYRVVLRGRDAMTGLPKHIDTNKPKLQVSTSMPFAGMGYESSTSPTISIRGCDSPHSSLPPPYAKDPSNDFPIGTFPQTPTAKPAHMWSVQKLSIKQEIRR
jgi:hypothetical protein